VGYIHQVYGTTGLAKQAITKSGYELVISNKGALRRAYLLEISTSYFAKKV
jgi:hypothetical protein